MPEQALDGICTPIARFRCYSEDRCSCVHIIIVAHAVIMK